MKQWEYDVEHTSTLFLVLEERGEEGWEAWHMVKSYDRNSGDHRYGIYFKRKAELNVREKP